MESATRLTRSGQYSAEPMNRSTQAQYYDGISSHPTSGELTAASDGLHFRGESPQHTRVHFPYAQMTEAVADESGCRIVIFIDAAETREFHFEDPSVLAAARHFRGDAVGGIRRVLYSIGEWSAARKILVAALILPFSLGAFFFGIERGHIFVPEIADRRLGDQAAVYLESGMDFCEDSGLEGAIAEMLERLVGEDASERYTIRIVRDSEVNALALPNGGIYLFSGLLAESESAAEVAGVIAHEIGHIDRRHSIRQLIQAAGFAYLATMLLGAGFEELETAETISELASLALFFKYSRDFEREADLYSIRQMHAAGIEGHGLLDFFVRRATADLEDPAPTYSLENAARALPDFLSSHPADKERAQYLEAELGGAGESGVREVAIRPLAAERGWKTLRTRCSDE